MKVLVTGGAGFIGSHTCVELLNAGHEVLVIDNLLNSFQEAVTRVKSITNKSLSFIELDILETQKLTKVIKEHKPQAVIHFAGLKAVGESVAEPLLYYRNNMAGTVSLCDAMKEAGVKNLVFSSSATVYGDPKTVPIKEDFPTSATNPYGRTKLMIEEMLTDLHTSDPSWNISLLRYFNPVGAHPSGTIGEDPQGIPNNLMPFIAQIAVGKREKLSVFGNDYDTHDGTGVRDYIHVVDLAIGHLKALEHQASDPGLAIFNLGTGQGYSVLDVIKAFEKASGKKIPFELVDRRAGDVATTYADPSYAAQELNWKTEKSLEQMCQDVWNWQSKNPNGYQP